MRGLLPVVVLIASALALSAAPPAAVAKKTAPQVQRDVSKLPERVQTMRSAILEAARTGDITALRPVLESNELMPLFANDSIADPIGYWKENSADGEGRSRCLSPSQFRPAPRNLRLALFPPACSAALLIGTGRWRRSQ